MKKIILFVIALLLVLSTRSEAADPAFPIVVSGEGVVFAPQDQADIIVVIEGYSNSNQKTALDEQAKKANQLLEFFRQNIDYRNISTLSFNYGPVYEYNRATQKNMLVGYRSTQNWRVRVPSSIGGLIIDGISEHARVNQVNFRLSNRSELVEAAIKVAISDAQAKARRRATSLGMSLGALLGYQEGAYQPQPRVMRGSPEIARAADAAPTPVLPTGEAEIRSVVYLTYELVPYELVPVK